MEQPGAQPGDEDLRGSDLFWRKMGPVSFQFCMFFLKSKSKATRLGRDAGATQGRRHQQHQELAGVREAAP